jgi:hypothetical protein
MLVKRAIAARKFISGGQAMKKQRMKWVLLAWLVMIPYLFLPAYSAAGDLSFLSFDSKEIVPFNLAFKQYIASFKSSKDLNQEKGTKAIAKAIDEFSALMAKAEKEGADAAILGRMISTKGLLIQAQGLIRQGRGEEGKELSIPIRSELYELHRSLNLLSAEDAMIMFHNGLMHRAEPLIEQGRFYELAMLWPRVEKNVAQFKTPPKSVGNAPQYSQMYGTFSKLIDQYTEAVKQLNEYVEPEYGAFMLKKNAMDAHNDAHSAFGKLYLSFPEGVGWKK